jgi:hypothetical protein
LTGCIPAIESNFTTVSEEIQRMNFHTNSCCIHQKYVNKLITSALQNQLRQAQESIKITKVKTYAHISSRTRQSDAFSQMLFSLH